MLTELEKGSLMKLFNRSGYVLDFSTADFDVFTMNSVGVALCTKYRSSKGRSLLAFIHEASEDKVYKIFTDLMSYYESEYSNFEIETQEKTEDLFYDSGKYRRLYLRCKDILRKHDSVGTNGLIVESVKKSFSTEYMSQQIRLMIDSQDQYPAEAIGKAKELIESCCKTILEGLSIPIDKDWTFRQLVSKVFDKLDIMPKSVDPSSPAADSLKRIYGNLKGMISPLAEIRNAFGTGHGQTVDFQGLDSRHAKLLVGMSATLVEFLWETYPSK